MNNLVTRRMAVAGQGAVDSALRTVRVRCITNSPIPKQDSVMLAGDIITGLRYEVFSMDPAAVNLDRFQNGAPVLLDHDHYDIASQVAVIDQAWLEPDALWAVMRFPDEGTKPASDKYFAMIQQGVISNVSIGASVTAYEATRDELPVYTFTQWEPIELSLVSIPADANARVMHTDAPVTCNHEAAQARMRMRLVGAQAGIW